MLQKNDAGPPGERKIRKIAAIILFAGFSLAAVLAAAKFFGKAGPAIHIAISIIAFFCMVLFRRKDLAHFIPVTLTLILFAECLLLKTQVFQFAPPSIAAPSQEVQAILKDPLLGEYKTLDSSRAWLAGFLPPGHPDLESGAAGQLQGFAGLTGLLFGFHSIGGALALQIDRRRILEPVLEKEVFAAQDSPFRMMDILGVKYISTSQPVRKPAFKLASFNQAHQIWIYQNKNAKPRFQIYCRARFVKSYEDALQKLKNSTQKTLFIEQARPNQNQPVRQTAIAGDPGCEDVQEEEISRKIKYLKKSSQMYELEIDTKPSVWLFLADAPYPGWEAKINGLPVEIYAAQVLGKAIHIPSGKNHIVIEYRPKMFYMGLGITSATVFLISVLLVWHAGKFFFRKERPHGNVHR